MILNDTGISSATAPKNAGKTPGPRPKGTLKITH